MAKDKRYQAEIDAVTNEQLYRAIMGVHAKIDQVVDNRIVPIERWQSNFTGKIAVWGSIALIAAELAMQEVRQKFKM